MVSEVGLACQTREPQAGQNMQCRVRPVSVGRDHTAGVPRVTCRAPAGTETEMPKAEADCFWHSRQWQT